MRLHSLRKTALNNALAHGAKVEDVQQWACLADLRTTQEYIAYKKNGLTRRHGDVRLDDFLENINIFRLRDS